MIKVTPNYEHSPERSYILEGKLVKCFSVVADDGKIFARKLTLSDEPIFCLLCPSEDSAQQLMNDLYYGEYTGA
ncbi:MAG: hypothetical protein AB7E55_34005 [Pigmentiphaga sp.]